eukprot:TRINITY_DN18662_c0_g1_i3.p1 TRINITY_DN18662_c0_g1~~TRINITY_DN18662_c0_g1_i3.p1  ORF type:complete len:621 (+),score=106.72 TRINITY_DN18662_c0_g1_i3:100-1863(+)
MGWFERVISMDGKLSGKERSNRRVLFVLSVVETMCALFYILASSSDELNALAVVGHSTFLISSVPMALACICRVHITPFMVSAFIGAYAVGIIVVDLNIRTMWGTSVWSAFVLLADLALVMRLGSRFAAGLVGTLGLWVVINFCEDVYRFGLFDVPGTASSEYRWKQIEQSSDCSTPPCPMGFNQAFLELFVSLIVLLVDFAATRGFAEEVEKEQAAMARTIETVEVVAQLLAGYDVDEVSKLLALTDGVLPSALHDALRSLEHNLRTYRPYLPKSCLPEMAAEECESALAASVTGNSCANSYASESSSRVSLLMVRKLGVVKPASATMLIANVRNTLHQLSVDSNAFSDVFDTLLHITMKAVEGRRGLVDVFIGDRIFASFNTSRACAVHATSASHAAKGIIRGTRRTADDMFVNIGIATGTLLCGDIGCVEMRRFSLIGSLSVVASGMERAARAFCLDVVCNKGTKLDAEHEHAFLLVPRLVRLVKITACGKTDHVEDTVEGDYPGSTFCAHELCTAVDEAVGPEEWLYEIGRQAARWAPLNRAVDAFVNGATIDEARQLGGASASDVSERLHRLGNRAPFLVQV